MNRKHEKHKQAALAKACETECQTPPLSFPFPMHAFTFNVYVPVGQS